MAMQSEIPVEMQAERLDFKSGHYPFLQKLPEWSSVPPGGRDHRRKRRREREYRDLNPHLGSARRRRHGGR
jgi:hypothetical protein